MISKKSVLVVLLSSFISFPVLSSEYEGKPISLNFTEGNTTNILGIIAKFSDKGLILPDSDLGTTSIYVKEIPWDEALMGIAKAEDLIIEVSDNAIIVSKIQCK